MLMCCSRFLLVSTPGLLVYWATLDANKAQWIYYFGNFRSSHVKKKHPQTMPSQDFSHGELVAQSEASHYLYPIRINGNTFYPRQLYSTAGKIMNGNVLVGPWYGSSDRWCAKTHGTLKWIIHVIHKYIPLNSE